MSDPAAPPPRPLFGSTKERLVLAAGLLGASALLLGLSFGLGPVHARKSESESSALSGLRTLTSAQTLFRETDKEGDGTLDYGTLLELSSTALVDPRLGAGKRQGYLFETGPSARSPEFLWFAVANPVEPTVDGDRYFCTNHAGVLYYTTSRAIALKDGGPDCAIPTHLLQVGR